MLEIYFLLNCDILIIVPPYLLHVFKLTHKHFTMNICISIRWFLHVFFITADTLGRSNYTYQFVASIFSYKAPIDSTITVYFNLMDIEVIWSGSIDLVVVPEWPQLIEMPKSLVSNLAH